MPTRPSLSKIAAMIALALLTAACSGPDTAAPATTKPAADAITDGHFRATFGDRTIDILAKDICLFGHVQDIGRSAIVSWQETAAEPLSFNLAMSPPPAAVGLQKVAAFSISHGNTGDVWMAPEHASMQITEFKRIEGGVSISGTFSDSYPAMIIPGQPQNPPMMVKGGFRNMECMDPAAFLPQGPEQPVPNSPVLQKENTMQGDDDGH